MHPMRNKNSLLCELIATELQWAIDKKHAPNHDMENIRAESHAISDGKIESVQRCPFSTIAQQLSDTMTSVNPRDFDKPVDFSGLPKLDQCMKLSAKECEEQLVTGL